MERAGIDYWLAGRDYHVHLNHDTDGVIVASSSDSHYDVAFDLMEEGFPVLIEKPVCMTSQQAESLLNLSNGPDGGIALVGHTRLYDPAWEDFKAGPRGPVSAFAGGVTASNPDPRWNWLPHLVAMCLDLGVDPERAQFTITEERQPLRFRMGGRVFKDSPYHAGAIDRLVRAFIDAIKKGVPDNAGLHLGLKTVQYIERHS